MRSERAALWAAGLLSLACEWVGGIKEYHLTSGTKSAPAECKFPAQGDAAVRLGHFASSAPAIDLCYRPSGGTAFAAHPVIQAGGSTCPPGITYEKVTTKIALPSGTYDFRVVAGASCQAAALGELSGVSIAAGSTSTLLLVEDATGRRLVALPEDPPDVTKVRVRFVNAVAGAQALRAGLTRDPRLPTILSSNVYGDVAFGAAATEQSGIVSVDSRGYGEFPPINFPMGAVLVSDGVAQTEALVTLQSSQFSPGTHTLYATGKLGDSTRPPRLMVCDEQGQPDGILSVCGSPVQVRVDAFNPYLTDRFATMIGLRAPAVATALGALDSELVCLSEVNRPEDVAAILATTAATFPYHATSRELIQSGLVSSALEDQSGVAPPVPTTPACDGVNAPLLEAVAQCLETSACFAQSLSDGEYYPTADGEDALTCLMGACYKAFQPLLSPSQPKGQACLMCVEVQLASYGSTHTMRARCANPASPDPKARFAFDGEPGLVVLSHYPIDGASLRLLPSTSWQRAVLRAPVLLPNGVPMDFYCTSLSEFPQPALIPYTGPYGNGQTGEAAVVEEALLQVSRVAGFVADESAGARPIVAGEFYAGPAYALAGQAVLEEKRPDVYAALIAAFQPLVPAGYQPACTLCAANPVLGSPDLGGPTGSWTTHIVGSGVLVGSAVSTSVTFADPALDATVNGQTVTLPVSPHYGLRSVLRVAQ
jgi:hypothetical protein